MFKKCLFFLMLGLIMPAEAGVIENALSKGDNVFLYLFSPECKYCDRFTPIYYKTAKAYNGQYSFFKIDSSTKYGRELMYEYRATYLPYVLLINEKKNKVLRLHPACILDDVCLQLEMEDFRG